MMSQELLNHEIHVFDKDNLFNDAFEFAMAARSSMIIHLNEYSKNKGFPDLNIDLSIGA